MTPLKESLKQIKICKICFKEFTKENFFTFVSKSCDICPNCQKLLNPKFIKFEVLGIKAISIYEYDENIKNFLYLFKGCYDIELKHIFLEKFKNELHLKFKNYLAIPAPSNKKEDKDREFNHVVEIFKELNIPIYQIFEKKNEYKQAKSNYLQRQESSKLITLSKRPNLENKNILLVDDVFTTGSTMKSMINLIKQLKPKRIKILVISKTILKPMT